MTSPALMPARVFISCGQIEAERRAARMAADWLNGLGYDPYIATEVQTLLDLNSEVIARLKQSDYFLFVNFRRESVFDSMLFRGSMFSNQELAIAYAMGFKHMILLNQKNTVRDGMFGFMVSNSVEFDDYTDLLMTIQQAVKSAGWFPGFSRNLFISELRCGHDVFYDDYSTEKLPNGTRLQCHCIAYVENGRDDIAAFHTMVRLRGYAELTNGVWVESPDPSNLKASGRLGYSHTIWPKSRCGFDLFALHLADNGKLFLNSEHDFRVRSPIISTPGHYMLYYEIFSEGFPLMPFKLDVFLSRDPNLTEASLDNRLRLVCVPHVRA